MPFVILVAVTTFVYWLHSGSTVYLDGGWHYDASEKAVRIELERSGHVDGSPDMAIEAALYYPDSPVPDVVSIPLDERGGTVSIDSEQKPARILLDPNTRLLAKWTFGERET